MAHPRATITRTPPRRLHLVQTFRPIVETLPERDHFLLLADFQSYIDAQERVSALWRNTAEWTRPSILNSARMSKCSSDRSIRDYCHRVWKITPNQPA